MQLTVSVHVQHRADAHLLAQGGYPSQLADIFRDLQASWHTLDDKGPIFQRLHAFCTAHPEVHPLGLPQLKLDKDDG